MGKGEGDEGNEGQGRAGKVTGVEENKGMIVVKNIFFIFILLFPHCSSFPYALIPLCPNCPPLPSLPHVFHFTFLPQYVNI